MKDLNSLNRFNWKYCILLRKNKIYKSKKKKKKIRNKIIKNLDRWNKRIVSFVFEIVEIFYF